MNGKDFIGKICPYCKGKLTESDDIVVCSECEMPHHKDCWIENQACTTFGCLGTISGLGNNEVTQQNSSEQPLMNIDIRYCMKCGKPHKVTDCFCSNCGKNLNNK